MPMALTSTCPHCKAPWAHGGEDVRKPVKCRKCGQLFFATPPGVLASPRVTQFEVPRSPHANTSGADAPWTMRQTQQPLDDAGSMNDPLASLVAAVESTSEQAARRGSKSRRARHGSHRIVVVVIAILLLAAGIGATVILRSRVTEEDFAKVRMQMTRQEVEAILGKPSFEHESYGPDMSPSRPFPVLVKYLFCEWYNWGSTKGYFVRFDPTGRVNSRGTAERAEGITSWKPTPATK